MTGGDELKINDDASSPIDPSLRRDCLRLFEACLAQIRSGLPPGPSLLMSREWEFALMSLCERLTADGRGMQAPTEDELVTMQFIVAANFRDAKDGLRTLRHWLKGAEEVILCDPYLLQYKPTGMFSDVEAYAKAIADLIPKSAKKVDLYSNSYSQKVRPAVLQGLKEGRNVRHFSSDQLHDRFLLKNGTEGKVLGTSLGGFGRKFFAVVDLDPTDVVEVIDQLRALCPNPLFHRR
ncbi:hypothetical protein [Devosia sp.]|uniref:hypothetical protein n=1 Tax=Devosia sp. TaxID=1871048 RepID=UPI0019F5BDF1|nr:hypothetical protein [Devosia sp.]MBE0580008.1 hypothetical protein [Devosia sp.]